jgi:hypothetical protein
MDSYKASIGAGGRNLEEEVVEKEWGEPKLTPH